MRMVKRIFLQPPYKEIIGHRSKKILLKHLNVLYKVEICLYILQLRLRVMSAENKCDAIKLAVIREAL